MSVLFFLIISYIFLSISLYLVFKKTDVEPWKALVPGLNFVEWCVLIGRKKLFALWLLFPIVNIFIFCGMAVDLVRSFKKYKFRHTAAAVIYAPAIFTYLGITDQEKYDSPTLTKEREYAQSIQDAKTNDDSFTYKKLTEENPYRKSGAREWVESIVFAVFAAAFIRMFLIEAYVIPTPSMEGSLLVGDFLFVSKAHYGIRPPMTIAMIPLLHNVIPGLGTESYLTKPSLPYKRFKAIETIDRYDPIVFNWPVGDSVYITRSRPWTVQQVENMKGDYSADRELAKLYQNKEFRVRPIDKKDHYIKRCMAQAGDTLQIIDDIVYIDGEEAFKPSQLQFQYMVRFPSNILKSDLDKTGITQNSSKVPGIGNGFFIGYLTKEDVQKLEDLDPKVKAVPFHIYTASNAALSQSEIFAKLDLLPQQRRKDTENSVLYLSFEQRDRLLQDSTIQLTPSKRANNIFPNNDKFYNWTTSNFGPLYIPKAGDEMVLTPKSLALYRRILDVYEDNEVEVKNGKVHINGEANSKYTFKQNYYWAMGDNRHNSEDSRMWGFVPEDHIVGKPLFIWFSLKNGKMSDGINWKRIFSSADIR